LPIAVNNSNRMHRPIGETGPDCRIGGVARARLKWAPGTLCRTRVLNAHPPISHDAWFLRF